MCLLALLRPDCYPRGFEPEQREDAIAGAMLLADGLQCLRVVRNFIQPKR